MAQPFNFNVDPRDGRSHLYLPEEMFIWSDTLEWIPAALAAASPDDRCPVLPFDAPKVVTEEGILIKMSCRKLTAQPLIRPPRHTSSAAHSHTAQSVQALEGQERLLYLKKGRKLLGRLRAYAFPQGQLENRLCPDDPQDFLDVGTPALLRSSWDNNAHHARIPTAAQQSQAILELRNVLAAQYARRPIAANSENAVSKQVAIQFLDIINHWLRTRYMVTPYILYADHPILRSYSSPPGTGDVEHDQLMRRLRHPFLGPACPDDSEYARNNPQFKKNSLAGHPDFLEYSGHRDHNVFGEAKVWTATTRENLSMIHQGTSDEMGVFFYNQQVPRLTNTLKLIKQVWGEAIFYGARLGFLTNGDQFVFFIRTKDNELVMSEALRWNSPNVYLCMLGLSMMGADASLGQVPLQDIINDVCPDDEQHRTSP